MRSFPLFPGSLLLGLALTLMVLPATPLFAQAEGVRIEPAVTLSEDEELLERAEAFLKTGKSLSVKQVQEQLRVPRPEAITLAEVRKAPLAGREIARTARKAFLRFGWFGTDEEGTENYFSLGAGYALTEDGVFATCYHVVDPETMKTGCLVAMREDGEILAVTAILARDKVLDAAIVRVDARGFEPLALNTDIAPGDAAYCFSDPLDAFGYFSSGVVNRFYRVPAPQRRRRPILPDSPSLLRMNVGTDWAPGSSGAAVLDQCGNAIGHVAAIWSLSDDGYVVPPETTGPDDGPEKPMAKEEKPSGVEKAGATDPLPKTSPEAPADRADEEAEAPLGPVLITLHEAIPASSILKMIEGTKPKPPER